MLVAKVVVGSRLHGLDTPDSDWDYRGIYMSPLVDILSPFKSLKTTSWIEDKVDDVSYELANFCKEIVHGNATYLEVLFSDKIITTSKVHQMMQENWSKFFDTKKFIRASRGYAHNQWNKFYNFDFEYEKGQKRTAKFAVAFLRVMWQCEQFLITGQFKCDMSNSDLYPLLRTIKPLTIAEIQKYLPDIVAAMSAMDTRVSLAEANTKYIYEPDIEWIEKFILQAYTCPRCLGNKHHCECYSFRILKSMFSR